MNSRDMYVGESGSGTLSITGGGLVSNAEIGYVGYNSGSTGRVTVTGAGSTWNSSSDLYISGNRSAPAAAAA